MTTLTPTITDEAIAPSAKTGDAIDTLIAAGSGRQVLEISLDRLVGHPDNPREDLGELTELTASIEAGGILEPLIVVTGTAFNSAVQTSEGPFIGDEDHVYVLLAGHRRYAAALEAAGVTTVPCIVRDDLAGPEGRAMMLVENMQRQGLNALEEAAGFAVLRSAPFKWSQEKIAAQVGVSQSHVSKRLSLEKLPPAIRIRVDAGAGGGCITLEQAAEISRQTSSVQNDIAARLAKVKNPRSAYEVADIIRWAIRDHERSKAQQSALKKLRELDVPVLNFNGESIGSDRITYSQENGPYPINWLRAFDDDLAAHASLLCHAAIIGNDQLSYDEDLEPEARWIRYVCTDPASHPDPEPAADIPAADPQLTPEEAAELERREQLRERAQRVDDVNKRRGEFIRRLVTATKTPKDAQAYVTASNVTAMLAGYWDPDDIICGYHGEFDDEKIRTLLVAAINDLEPNVDGTDQLTRWALYMRLVHDDPDIRTYLAKDDPQHCPPTSRFVARRTLTYLISAGYDPSDDEKPLLADTTSAVEAAAEYNIPGFEPADDTTGDVE